ncbi:glycosyltransferase [uncultured Rhodoblastus sp.]|uniref:glycosyltransferase n=1 Tax=uncultured Rhodoblastus sp. TaxID=543037 RepID=UPI0025E733EA|nr:glycosyltransferase [uncultured Rhodoblastus sp.]
MNFDDFIERPDMKHAKKILVIVPIYKNVDLIPGLFRSIAAAEDELATFDTKVLFINDSPDDLNVAAALASHLSYLPNSCDAAVIANEANLGFITSCNKGLELALAEGRDAILLNSDALLTPGAILEMAELAYEDPLIGFVSPRSNNATICNSPYPDRYRELGVDAAIEAHRYIEQFLPRMTYVPTAVGFCLYIRHLMLLEFGMLDVSYGRGYNEENDFIMRCNQRGYRAVLANHAFVYHLGEASFLLTQEGRDNIEEENRNIFIKRYPEYTRSVERYFNSVEFKAQSVVSGLIPDEDGRLRILFECSNLGRLHNGTSEFAKKVIKTFVDQFADRYACFIHCSQEALKFHGLDSINVLSQIDQLDGLAQASPFAAAICLSQPFSKQDLTSIARLAPVTAFVMLDTIAMDCQYIDTFDLKRLWDWMLQTTALIGYNSRFSRDQFRRRFDVPEDVVEFVAFHSVDTRDYLPQKVRLKGHGVASSMATPLRTGDYVLIVGNHYSHKHVRDTLSLFNQMENPPPIVVLGLHIEDSIIRASYQSGELSDDLVESLYANADSLLFPSHYEGFGFPIMHALKYRKPVIARDLPGAMEIKAGAVSSVNIHLFATTPEMVAFASTRPSWIEADNDKSDPPHDWDACAVALEEGLSKAIVTFQFTKLRTRLSIAELIGDEILRDAVPAKLLRASLVVKLRAVWRHPFNKQKRRLFRNTSIHGI